jgi:hypothetical protein
MQYQNMDGYKQLNAMKKKVIGKLKIDAKATKSLKHYKYVNELHELTTGRYIRWVNVNDLSKLMNGGFVVNVDIEDYGTLITCKNWKNMFFRLYMDECIIFQRITPEEHIILMANDI